jgi:hypothetical protein
MNTAPYSHIVLFDTPPDPEWIDFTNNLEGLFIHELTHAVSMNSRGRFFDALHRVFGGWAHPTELTAPFFMMEGAAVSFESLDGTGRANNPLVRQKLRQDIYEDKFLSPFQVSGVSELPGAQGAYYEYGGLFSRYLQQNYGMEKYAQLWQTMGKSIHVSLFFYNHGFYNAFRTTYALDLREVWEEFRQDLALENIEDNSAGLVRKGLPPQFPGTYRQISGIAAAEGRLFMLDDYGRQLVVYNPAAEKTEKIIPMGTNAYGIEASADAQRILVSSYSLSGGRAEAVVTEHRTGSGLPGRVWRDLYQGAYFRDGVIGLSSDRHINSLVFRSGPGGKNSPGETVLLRGSAELVFSSPRPLNDSWIAFIASRRGRRELGLYHFDTRQVYRVATDLADDGERWRYIHTLRVSEGKLLFTYNHDDRMYKLGVIDPSGLGQSGEDSVLWALFAERDFSGAVSLPVMADGAVYYRGTFSDESRLMRYPEAGAALTGQRARVTLEPWDPVVAETGALSAADALSGDETGPIAADSGKWYFPLKYYNPLLFWLPIPLINETREGTSLEGGGILTLIMDPAAINRVFLQTALSVPSEMMDTELTWTNQSLGFPLQFDFKDKVNKIEYKDRRVTEASVAGLFSHSLGVLGLSGSLMPGFGVTFTAWDDLRGSGAYSWEYNDDPIYTFQFGTGISKLHRFPWETFGHGFSLNNYARLAVFDKDFERKYSYFGYTGILQTAFEPLFPARIRFYGAWDEYGLNLRGQSSADLVFKDIASSEYHTVYFNRVKWIAGGEAELLFFSFDIQLSLSHLYFNRLFGTLAYRAALYDASEVYYPKGSPLGENLRLTQSLIFRFKLATTNILITPIPIRFTPEFLSGFRLTNTNNGPDAQNDYWFGFSYKLEY